MTTTNGSGAGVYQRVTDPAGATYLLHALPSGTLVWPVYAAQTVLAGAVQAIATPVVHRLVFRGGWTVLAWRGDAVAPKRQRVHKERFRTEAEALSELDRLTTVAATAGLTRT